MLRTMPARGTPMQPKWGRIIQQRREERSWSIRWAARQAGMSDVFWAQMERGYKRVSGRPQPVTPSLGSLLQAAAALRLDPREIDVLVESAGYNALPRRYLTSAEPISTEEAIERDPNLIDEAKQHLINQYGLLLRLSPSSAKTQSLRAVARSGDPQHRGQVQKMARAAREQHERETKKDTGKDE